jgi:hypothetical protein
LTPNLFAVDGIDQESCALNDSIDKSAAELGLARHPSAGFDPQYGWRRCKRRASPTMLINDTLTPFGGRKVCSACRRACGIMDIRQ